MLRALAALAFGCLPIARGQPASAPPATVLTTARQALDLALERARPGNISARIRGTLTYQVVTSPHWVFVQDDTGGILVILNDLPFPVAPGQIVEAEGMVEAGAIAPYIRAKAFRLLGTGPMPEPRKTDPAYLADGNLFGHWVSITATVRDVAITKERLVLVCASGETHFQVWTTMRDNIPVPAQLLDARVRLEGIPWVGIDPDGHANGFRLHQSSTNSITILNPGSEDIFQCAKMTTLELRGALSNRTERVRVVGEITFSSPEGWLALRDQTGAMVAHVLKPLRPDEDPKAKYVTRNFPLLRPGDRVELVGAPVAANTIAPDLEDAEYRILGRDAAAVLQPVSASQLETGAYDGELITFKACVVNAASHHKAHIIDVERHHDVDLFESRVWLQADGFIIEALLESHEPAPLPVQRNEYVQVNGVCRVEPGELQAARPVRIYLRDAADVSRRDPPPWWASRQTVAILGAGTALGLASAAWIALLRRRVAQQTAKLRASEERLRRALEKEKQLHQLKSNFVSMVSHEIRTPLAKILSSSDLLRRYLDRLTPEERNEQIISIQQAVDRMRDLLEDVLLFGRAEAGKLAFNGETFDLETFCRQMVEEAAAQKRNPIEARIAGVEAPAFGDATLLRHIVSNLMGNAVKYSPAGAPVTLEVTRQGREAVLRVRDNGIGVSAEDFKQLFVPFFRGHNATPREGTGLGLLIVRHCVERHGGRIEIASTENAGTTVTVRLPVFAPPLSQATSNQSNCEKNSPH